MLVSIDDIPFVYYTVLLNEIDVSDHCYKADSEKGKVWLYSKDIYGNHIIKKNGDIEKHIAYGNVTIIEKEI